MEKILENGHKIKILNEEEVNEVKDNCIYFEQAGALRLYPEDLLLPQNYTQLADKYYEYKFRPRDVLVQGYFKTGTTWLQEVVWTMLNNPNFDNPRGNLELFVRSPMFEGELYVTIDLLKSIPHFYDQMKKTYPQFPFEDSLHHFEALEDLPDCRVMKCHLPLSLLHPKALDTAKSIYIMRDPRDSCISYYHMAKGLMAYQYRGTLEQYMEAIMAKKRQSWPRKGNHGQEKAIMAKKKTMFGDPATHMKLFHPYFKHKNVLPIFYEDLKREPLVQLKNLDKFLETNLSQQQLEKIKHYISFDQMKKQDSWFNDSKSEMHCEKKPQEDTYQFYRKGMIGEYKERFSAKMISKFDEYLKENLQGLDLPYV